MIMREGSHGRLLGALMASACLLSLSALPRSQDEASPPFEVGLRVGLPPYVSRDAGTVRALRGDWMLVDVQPSNTGTAGPGGRLWFNLAQLTAVSVEAPEPDAHGKVKTAEAEIRALRAAIDQFAMDNGMSYPDSLQLLVTPDANGHRYLPASELTEDPWGNDYIYEAPGPGRPRPRISSLGADGKPGGEGENADIDSEMLRGR